MEQDQEARLREDLERWTRLLENQTDPRVRKSLEDLIVDTKKRLQERAPPAQKTREDL